MLFCRSNISTLLWTPGRQQLWSISGINWNKKTKKSTNILVPFVRKCKINKFCMVHGPWATACRMNILIKHVLFFCWAFLLPHFCKLANFHGACQVCLVFMPDIKTDLVWTYCKESHLQRLLKNQFGGYSETSFVLVRISFLLRSFPFLV